MVWLCGGVKPSPRHQTTADGVLVLVDDRSSFINFHASDAVTVAGTRFRECKLLLQHGAFSPPCLPCEAQNIVAGAGHVAHTSVESFVGELCECCRESFQWKECQDGVRNRFLWWVDFPFVIMDLPAETRADSASDWDASTTGGSESGQRERPCGLRRLQIVSDAGECVFDRVWLWELDVSPDRVANLIQSMQKFGREIDGGCTDNEELRCR
jgi:hypothetical protein